MGAPYLLTGCVVAGVVGAGVVGATGCVIGATR